MKVTE